jgi:hypothetical protein
MVLSLINQRYATLAIVPMTATQMTLLPEVQVAHWYVLVLLRPGPQVEQRCPS